MFIKNWGSKKKPKIKLEDRSIYIGVEEIGRTRQKIQVFIKLNENGFIRFKNIARILKNSEKVNHEKISPLKLLKYYEN